MPIHTPQPSEQPEELGLMRVFRVKASNMKDRQHYFGVAWNQIGLKTEYDYFCSCPGFNFRQTCKHVDMLKVPDGNI